MKIWFYLFCRNSGHPWWQGSRLHLRSAVHGVGWEPELVPWRQYQDTHHKSHQRPEGGWRFYREQQDARWEMLILLISACKMKSSGLILYVTGINGYLYGNLPGLSACQGNKIHWHLIGLGNEVTAFTFITLQVYLKYCRHN